MKTPRLKKYFLALAVAAAHAATLFAAAAPSTDFSAFKLITDRNIFNPNRLPRSRFNTVRRASSVQRVTESLSLVGTMSYEKGDLAFFDGTSAEFRKTVKPGETVAGLTLSAVGTNFVRVLQGTNEATLPIGTQLRRDDEGNWAIPDSAFTFRNRRNTGWQRDYGSNRPPVEAAADTPAPQNSGDNQPAPGIDNASANADTPVIVIEQPAADAQQPDAAPADNNTPAADAAPVSDALQRLMQLRAQEEQQLQR